MTKHKGFGRLAPLVIAGALTASSGCETPPEAMIEPSQQEIFNGTAITTGSHLLGAVRIRAGARTCSGTIYNTGWVLTAAHCFANTDANNDGTISPAEGATEVTVENGVDANGAPLTLRAAGLIRHPQGAWAVGGTVDVAMVFLNGGFAVNRLDQSRYTNWTLNVYQGSPSSLRGQMVRAMGYGPSFSGDTSRVLRSAIKTVTDPISTTRYAATLRNNRGTSCPGDSGGPDFALTSPESVAGVHSTGDTSCNGGNDGNVAAAAWRDWAAQTARGCLFATPSCPG